MSTVPLPRNESVRLEQNRPRFVADSAQMIGRSLRHTVRGVETLLVSVMLPVILLLLFVYVFGGAIGGAGYVDYVVPGIIVLCAGFGASQTAVSVATDLSSGIIRRFRTMAIVSSAVLTGHVVASVARNIVSTLLVFGVAFLAGFRPHAGAAGWLAVAGVLLLFVVAISWLSAALGLLAGNPEAANGVTFAVMFLPYLSSAFVPIDTMPGVLQAIARHQPLTPVVDTLRGLLLGTPVGSSGWLAVVWLVGIGLGSAVLSAWLFRRRTT
ncbi:ABC transporter permease [Angustibacter luteus]|uniref:Transport permease protein n=1 Tax=Angustibacter luteus TaxID=658456 RepID=A0ABW1JHG9_9ACTN